jgi:hypothetical protein
MMMMMAMTAGGDDDYYYDDYNYSLSQWMTELTAAVAAEVGAIIIATGAEQRPVRLMKCAASPTWRSVRRALT